MGLRKRNKKIYGIGINDADYKVVVWDIVQGVRKIIFRCPFYDVWCSMIERCYSDRFKSKSPSYADCTTCPEWIYFSRFKAWMEVQDWEGSQLDKDLLVRGNKIYGPKTCIFIPGNVNTFMIERGRDRGKWPIGVAVHPPTGKFQASCSSVIEKRPVYLGLFATPEEAHAAWLKFKLEQAYILAAEQTDERISKALIERYENYAAYP